MVAINSLNKYLIFVALLSLFTQNVSVKAEEHITALEGDSTYMALISRANILVNREDSLSSLLVTYRDEFAADGDKAAQASRAIVDIEMELFDVRGERNDLDSSILAVEQQWVIDNPSSTMEVVESDDGAATIVGSRLARESLSEGDYENLRVAELVELKCAVAYGEYMDDYERMRELLQLYSQTDQEEEAIGYSSEFHALKQKADSLSNVLTINWRNAYDNKYFAYNLLMEMSGFDDTLTKSDRMARECEAQISAGERGCESDDVVRYNFQKRNILALESLFAEHLGLKSAVDSLAGASKRLANMAIFEELPELVFVKRNFILYEPVLFSTAAVYDASNPIPEMVTYKKGSIYRIQYGAFNSKQSPSIFHGAHPLSYERVSGLWTYYGGGYETYAEADEAAALCKRKGFKRPEVVMWRDGEKRNLYRDPFSTDQKYRVQMVGLAELSEQIKGVITAHCPDAELSKIGADRYVVGPLIGLIVAEEFAAALERVSGGALTTDVVEIE